MKVGIITMYHKSRNYGGLLQAFALCTYLNKFEKVKAEQICYNSKSSYSANGSLKRFRDSSFNEKFSKVRRLLVSTTNRLLTNVLIKNKINLRDRSVSAFRERIPHSEDVYDSISINRTNSIYDVFVTGSDRVWNPMSIGSPYYLSFVDGKTKIAYAASLAANSLNEEQRRQFKEVLSDYSLVSVREKETVDILGKITDNKVYWTVDPTFLLDKEEWQAVATDRKVEGDYIFCYFLGRDAINRKVVTKFARKRNLKIVTIPYANNIFSTVDAFFGDVKVFDASPEDFIGLISKAKFVFTDSFHATVFSTIFEREVFTFVRSEMHESGTRIKSLTDLLGTESHYVRRDKLSLSYIDDTDPINYDDVNKRLNMQIEKSKGLLFRVICNN